MKCNLKSVKYLTFGLVYKAGKNFSGRLVIKSKGSRKTKRKYRIIDFYRLNYKIPAYVLRIEYDPNRSAKIALICYKNGILSYIIANEGLVAGMIISQVNFISGRINNLQAFKVGSFISCIELYPSFGAKITRAAGCFSIILAKKFNNIKIRLSSGEERLVKNKNKAILGVVSNIGHILLKKKKAGNNIWIGLKPRVRGVAQNCVDHPHGGGRGKTPKLVTAVNFTKRVLKGVPSIKKKKKFMVYCTK